MVAPELFVQSRNAMGTAFTIYLYARREPDAHALFESAFDEIERLDETLSNYRASSELSRINRLAAHEAVTTDPEVFGLLETALDFSLRSEGAFDITVGPLMRAWGLFRGNGSLPSEEELGSARETVGFHHLLLHPPTRTVRFAVPDLELDPGAIGKGYAVDRVAAVLVEAGVRIAFIDAGSSTVYAIGAPPGEAGWKVHVPDPQDRSRALTSVTLRDQSLSTSGNYQQFFEAEGRRYCHVMDPRTATPVQGILQTTMIASDSTTTDALSNAMFVLGPETGSKLLAGVPDSRGLWVLDVPGRRRVMGWQWDADS